MLSKRRVKAGVLIYAVLMAAIFSLLLQFYLDRVIASQRQYLAMENHAEAYVLAQLTKVELEKDPDKRQFYFDSGQVKIEGRGDHIDIEVTLGSGEKYHFDDQVPKQSQKVKRGSKKSKSQRSRPSKKEDDEVGSEKQTSDSSDDDKTTESSSTSQSESETSSSEGTVDKDSASSDD